MTDFITTRGSGKTTNQTQRFLAQVFSKEYGIPYEEALKAVIEEWYSE